VPIRPLHCRWNHRAVAGKGRPALPSNRDATELVVTSVSTIACTLAVEHTGHELCSCRRHVRARLFHVLVPASIVTWPS